MVLVLGPSVADAQCPQWDVNCLIRQGMTRPNSDPKSNPGVSQNKQKAQTLSYDYQQGGGCSTLAAEYPYHACRVAGDTIAECDPCPAHH